MHCKGHALQGTTIHLASITFEIYLIWFMSKKFLLSHQQLGKEKQTKAQN